MVEKGMRFIRNGYVWFVHNIEGEKVDCRNITGTKSIILNIKEVEKSNPEK